MELYDTVVAETLMHVVRVLPTPAYLRNDLIHFLWYLVSSSVDVFSFILYLVRVFYSYFVRVGVNGPEDDAIEDFPC